MRDGMKPRKRATTPGEVVAAREVFSKDPSLIGYIQGDDRLEKEDNAACLFDELALRGALTNEWLQATARTKEER